MCSEQACPRATLPSAPAWKYLLIADDLTSADLCVTTAEICLTCGPAFYPERFSRLCKIAALVAKFLTYTPRLSFSCGYVKALYFGFEYLLSNDKTTGKTRAKIDLAVNHVISGKPFYWKSNSELWSGSKSSLLCPLARVVHFYNWLKIVQG